MAEPSDYDNHYHFVVGKVLKENNVADYERLCDVNMYEEGALFFKYGAERVPFRGPYQGMSVREVTKLDPDYVKKMCNDQATKDILPDLVDAGEYFLSALK